MQASWGDLNLTNAVSGLVATTVGVYLGFLANSLRERINRRGMQKRLIYAATREIFVVIADLEAIRNGLANGTMAKALGLKPYEAVRLNAPGRPLLFPKLVAELESKGRGNLGPMLGLLRTWSNTERLNRALETLELAQEPSIVTTIDAIMAEYAQMTWGIRGMHLGKTEKFKLEEWRSLLNAANAEDNLDKFFESASKKKEQLGIG